MSDKEQRIAQLEEQVEKLSNAVSMPTRRETLAAGGLLGAGALLGGGVGDTEAATVGQVGTSTDRVDVFGASGDFNSVSTGQLTNTDTSRIAWTTTTKTVTVDPAGGADYSSLQTAVDSELPYFVGQNLTFDLADATYNEDVTVPGFLSQKPFTSVDFLGNSTTPGNVNGLSFAVLGATGTVGIDDLRADREHPAQSENAGIIAYNSVNVDVDSCEFRSVGTSIMSYNSSISAAECDFGSSSVTTAYRTKGANGFIKEQATNASSITGTTTGSAYKADEGTIVADTSSGVTGSPTYDPVRGRIISDQMPGVSLTASGDVIINDDTGSDAIQVVKGGGSINIKSQMISFGGQRYVTEDLTTRTGSQWEIAAHDGTGTPAEGLYHYDPVNSQWTGFGATSGTTF